MLLIYNIFSGVLDMIWWSNVFWRPFQIGPHQVTHESPVKVYSLSNAVEEEDQLPYTVKEEYESVGNSSIEGSITSYDEVIEVTHPPPKKNSLPICNKLTVQSNTTIQSRAIRGIGCTADWVESIWIDSKRWQWRKWAACKEDDESSSCGSYESDSFESE